MSLVGFSARNHPQQQRKDRVDDRGTDPAWFDSWHRRFGFTVDAAASERNAKLDRFWALDTNGLNQDWTGERVWCNPPYSDIGPWVAKADAETGAELVVMLLPANRTEQRWWQTWIEPHRDRGGRLTVEFLAGRLRFVPSDAERIGMNQRPPFGCCLAIWSAV